MFALKRLLPAAALASMLVLPACSDSTSPGNVDASMLNSSFNASMTTFQSNPAFQSISILADHLPPLAISATMPLLVQGPGFSLRGRTLAAFSSRLRASAMSPQALFPANLLGKTLAWDTLTNTYIAGAATGAPAAGIRLMLYFADPQTGLPFRPLQVLGYMDLTDKSTPQADKLGVVLTLVQTQVANYDITFITNTSSATASATGFFLDGTGANRVDFGFSDVIDIQAGSLAMTNELSSADGTDVHVGVAANILTGSTTIQTRVARDHAAIDVGVTTDDNDAVVGSIKYNGVTVGSISGSGDNPQIQGSAGHTFSAAEQVAVVAIFFGALDLVSVVANGVFAPGNIVFGGGSL